MRRSSALRLTALAAFIVVSASGCYYTAATQYASTPGAPAPWFCNPVAPNSVTGPGMGTTNWYAGTTRAPLAGATCQQNAFDFDVAKAYAEIYPTLGDAEAAGFLPSFPYIPGMGTHHGLGTISPQLLASPTFDRFNPIIPGSIVDDVFNPRQPEFLQYNGNGDDAVLVGMSYYVRTTTGLPPEGFPGNNDWWHHHLTLCLNPTTALANGVNTSDSQCAARGGINVYLDDYYMLHVWLVDDIEYHADVHAPMHPCIQGAGAIFDMDDPCHDSALGGAAARTAAASATTTDPTELGLFCPIGTLAPDES
jgi:hypothetical protein